MITITLNQIKACEPCAGGWERIVKARNPKADADYDIAFPLSNALKSNELHETIWALRCIPDGKLIAVKFANFVAKQAAGRAAYAAADAADAAYAAGRAADAAGRAAYAAYAAGRAAYAATRDAQIEELKNLLDNEV